jgi:hypothetical protein
VAFQSLLEQLLVVGSLINDEDNVIFLMKSMPTSYKSFLVTLKLAQYDILNLHNILVARRDFHEESWPFI